MRESSRERKSAFECTVSHIHFALVGPDSPPYGHRFLAQRCCCLWRRLWLVLSQNRHTTCATGEIDAKLHSYSPVPSHSCSLQSTGKGVSLIVCSFSTRTQSIMGCGLPSKHSIAFSTSHLSPALQRRCTTNRKTYRRATPEEAPECHLTIPRCRRQTPQTAAPSFRVCSQGCTFAASSTTVATANQDFYSCNADCSSTDRSFPEAVDTDAFLSLLQYTITPEAELSLLQHTETNTPEAEFSIAGKVQSSSDTDYPNLPSGPPNPHAAFPSPERSCSWKSQHSPVCRENAAAVTQEHSGECRNNQSEQVAICSTRETHLLGGIYDSPTSVTVHGTQQERERACCCSPVMLSTPPWKRSHTQRASWSGPHDADTQQGASPCHLVDAVSSDLECRYSLPPHAPLHAWVCQRLELLEQDPVPLYEEEQYIKMFPMYQTNSPAYLEYATRWAAYRQELAEQSNRNTSRSIFSIC